MKGPLLETGRIRLYVDELKEILFFGLGGWVVVVVGGGSGGWGPGEEVGDAARFSNFTSILSVTMRMFYIPKSEAMLWNA